MALYVSMSFVSLRLSGYSCSSIVLLYSSVSVGVRKVARSFMIAGLILYMSLALFGLIFSVFLSLFFLWCVGVQRGGIFLCVVCFLLVWCRVWNQMSLNMSYCYVVIVESVCYFCWVRECLVFVDQCVWGFSWAFFVWDDGF